MVSTVRPTGRWSAFGCALATGAALLATPAAAAQFALSRNDKVVGKLRHMCRIIHHDDAIKTLSYVIADREPVSRVAVIVENSRISCIEVVSVILSWCDH